MKLACRTAVLLVCLCASVGATPTQQTNPTKTSSATGGAPNSSEWRDDFEGDNLDSAKWEPFTFEGERGARVEVKGGQLRQRGRPGARSGVRSRQLFTSSEYFVEATLAKVGPAVTEPEPATPPVSPRAPEPEVRTGESGVRKTLTAPESEARELPRGYAILTLIFDDTGNNRIEWIMTNERIFEAWAMLGGRGTRLDLNNIGTKLTTPRLAIRRRGDEFTFLVNDQIALQRNLQGVPNAFRVMLYGFSTTQNDWDWVRVFVRE